MVACIPDPTAEKQPLLKRQEFGCTIKQQPRVEDRTNGMEWCGRLQHLKRRPSEAVLLMWRAPCQVVSHARRTLLTLTHNAGVRLGAVPSTDSDLENGGSTRPCHHRLARRACEGSRLFRIAQCSQDRFAARAHAEPHVGRQSVQAPRANSR